MGLEVMAHVSANQIGRKHSIGAVLVTGWGRRCLEDGEEEPGPGNGNHYGALHRSKLLSAIEHLLVAKQEAETARLKRAELLL